VVKSTRFVELDEKEMTLTKAGRKRRSRNGEIWATNAFDEWWRYHGLSTEESIGDLSEKEDINILLKFVLQVGKTNGSLYPPTPNSPCIL
jgi:hypothetical protein